MISLLGADTGVCEKDTPPEKTALGTTSLNNAKSGAGEEFLLLFSRAEAHIKGMFFSQAPIELLTRYLEQLFERDIVHVCPDPSHNIYT